MSPAEKGAASELMVCADLLHRGWEVFRSVSPHCSCDLVGSFDGRLRRIEVKSTNWKADGTPAMPQADKRRFDVLALVIDRHVIYLPDLGTVENDVRSSDQMHYELGAMIQDSVKGVLSGT